jgi:AcrR family transcriptional regulator
MATQLSAGRRRRHSRRAPDAPLLDRHAILAAALQLVDEEGLDALSMRRLGARLGVEAMTLYYYLPNKAALVQGLAEAVLDKLELPAPPVRDWPSMVRDVARSFRSLGLRHPEVFPLLATLGLDNPASFRPTDTILQGLCAAGFDQQLAFTAFSTIKSFVVGHILWTLGDRLVGHAQRIQPPDTLPAGTFPTLASYGPYLAACDPDDEFERGLDLLVTGLHALRQGVEFRGSHGEQPAW